jgi:hypothetical protein
MTLPKGYRAKKEQPAATKETQDNKSGGSSNDNADRYKKEEVLLDLVKRLYDAEWQRTKDLDSKAGSLIGYVTIVTGLIIGLGTFSILDKLSLPVFYVPYFIGISALLLSIVISLFAIKVTTWEFSPRIEDLEEYYKDPKRVYKSVIVTVLFHISQAVKINFNINQSKATRISLSWICLVIGIGSMVVYAGIFVAMVGSQKTETKITIDGNSTVIKEVMTKVFQTIANKTAKSILYYYFSISSNLPLLIHY